VNTTKVVNVAVTEQIMDMDSNNLADKMVKLHMHETDYAVFSQCIMYVASCYYGFITQQCHCCMCLMSFIHLPRETIPESR